MYPITLTSDFGLQNHHVASVKGKVLFQIPEANLVDISHGIIPYNLQQAAYIFKSAYLHFPPGTIHFVFNDLYADVRRQLLYAFENGQHIFCADNGFITLLFDDRPARIFVLKDPLPEYNYLQVAEVFAHNALNIIQGLPPNAETISVNSIVVKKAAFAFETGNSLEAQVLYIDTYGNVVINVTRAHFMESARGRKFKIFFMRDEEIHSISEHYNDVPMNEKLCLFNSSGYLEIAVNKGNAASLFGFKDVDDRSLFYSNIKIFFE